MRVVVCSVNPVKINAVSDALFRMAVHTFELSLVDPDSGVSHQPFGDEETMQGAKNRMFAARRIITDANFYVAIESGLCKIGDVFFERSWVLISDFRGVESWAASLSMPVPAWIGKLIEYERSGLGGILDRHLGRVDVKKQEGFPGVATNNVITRGRVTEDAVVGAFSRFFMPGLYEDFTIRRQVLYPQN